MDSDILFVGPVFSLIDKSDADFVVSWEPGIDSERRTYYSYSKILKKIDSDFRFPGYCFCNGNIVATSGLLKIEDFSPHVDFDASVPRLIRPDIFFCVDQGLINYVLQSKSSKGEVTIDTFDYTIWGFGNDVRSIDLDKVLARSFRPAIVHWAGCKSAVFCRDPRGDLWEAFDRIYYSRVPFGRLKRIARSAKQSAMLNIVNSRLKIENFTRSVLAKVGLLAVARQAKRKLLGYSVNRVTQSAVK